MPSLWFEDALAVALDPVLDVHHPGLGMSAPERGTYAYCRRTNEVVSVWDWGTSGSVTATVVPHALDRPDPHPYRHFPVEWLTVLRHRAEGPGRDQAGKHIRLGGKHRAVRVPRQR